MTPSDAPDPMFRMLARLPSAAPSAASVDRVRARCHVALVRRQQPSPQMPQRGSFQARLVDAALVGAVCLYLAEAVREAFRLSSLL